jgi:hypothetical protein
VVNLVARVVAMLDADVTFLASCTFCVATVVCCSKRRRVLDPSDRRLSQRWRWRVDERCVVPVRAFVTGLEPWTERDEVRNDLGVVLAKLLGVWQLEGLL